MTRGEVRAKLVRRAGAALLVSLIGSAALADDGLVFELERYNGSYPGLETEMKPIERGPLSVRLSSPGYDLEVLGNRLKLEPADDCRHRGNLWGRFSGEGDLVAEVELGTFPARFDDRVQILEQEKELEALMTVDVADDGYRVTLEELPDSTTIAIESDLVRGLVSFCRRVSLFVVGDAGCGVLDRLLSNPSVALPPPGTRFLVRRDQLEADEQARLESYLAEREGCGLPALAGGPAG